LTCYYEATEGIPVWILLDSLLRSHDITFDHGRGLNNFPPGGGGRHLHEIALRTASTAMGKNQAQFVTQRPCLGLLMGLIYPVLVGFVGVPRCSRHVDLSLCGSGSGSVWMWV
jgi:hypothetical protein